MLTLANKPWVNALPRIVSHLLLNLISVATETGLSMQKYAAAIQFYITQIFHLQCSLGAGNMSYEGMQLL